MEFDQVLPYSIDFTIPGYERSYPQGIFKCLSFTKKDSHKWFFEFVAILNSAIGKRHFPIYRMGDGEFQFAVGYKYPLRNSMQSWSGYATLLVRSWMSQIFHKFIHNGIRAGGRSYRSGTYSITEISNLKVMWVKQLRTIAQRGGVALGLTYRETQCFQPYFEPIVEFLKRNDIELNEFNYFPFYFIYGLLNSPMRHQLYTRHNILIITSFDDEKRSAIERTLIKENVSSIQFLSISPDKSMYDRIDLTSVRLPVDVVLVGAGIGASNILCQLEPLNTLAIDAGYCIECLANPELKKQRTFCWPDEERDGDYRPI